MADSPRTQLIQLRIVFVTWVLAGAANVVAVVHSVIKDFPLVALPNVGVVVLIACLHRLVLRPRLAKARAQVRRQESESRQARIAELEKELGTGCVPAKIWSSS